MARLEYPECGKIINTHGCRGAVKVESWCDTPAVLAALPRVFLKEGGQYRPIKVRHASVFKAFVFVELEGVDTMEAADALRGRVLHAAREDLGLADGVLLVAELIGLPVYHADTGASLGRVADVIHPAAHDIYVIKTEKGEAMVPAVAEFVVDVDAERGIALRPIEGLFDDEI